MDDLSAKEESSEIAIHNDDGATQRKKPVQEDNADNYVNNIIALTEELDKVKEENEALGGKLKESERKAEMIKNEVKNIAIKLVK
jgi:predicted RNase H-like nuclease (RuvC/YqgF family)